MPSIYSWKIRKLLEEILDIKLNTTTLDRNSLNEERIVSSILNKLKAYSRFDSYLGKKERLTEFIKSALENPEINISPATQTHKKLAVIWFISTKKYNEIQDLITLFKDESRDWIYRIEEDIEKNDVPSLCKDLLDVSNTQTIWNYYETYCEIAIQNIKDEELYQQTFAINNPFDNSEELVSRDGLTSLVNEILNNNNAKLIGIIGQAGCGKSSVLKMLYDELTKQERIIFGFRLYQSNTVESFFQKFIEYFKIFVEQGAKQEKIVKAVCDYISFSKKKLVIIIDQLEQIQYAENQHPVGQVHNQMYESLRDAVKKSPNSKIVYASWYKDCNSYSKDVHKVINDFKNLTRNDELELLAKYKIKWKTKDELERLIQKFEGLVIFYSILCPLIHEKYSGDISNFLRAYDFKVLIENQNDSNESRLRMLEWVRKHDGYLSEYEKLLLEICSIFKFQYEPDESEIRKVFCKILEQKSISDKYKKVVDIDKLNQIFEFNLENLRKKNFIRKLEGRLIVHHLIREDYFKIIEPDMIINFHEILYYSLSSFECPKPKLLEDIFPWIRAIYHGIQCGKIDETFNEIYLKKLRGISPQSYIAMSMGLWSANEEILKDYFKYRDILEGDILLKELDNRSKIINQLGLSLLNNGSLKKAEEFFEIRANQNLDAGFFYASSINFYHLSGIKYRLCKISEAIRISQLAIDSLEKAKVDKNYKRAQLLEAEANLIGRLAFCYFLDDNKEDAEKYFILGEKMLPEKLEYNEIIGIPIVKYADYLLYTKQYEKAEQELKRKLDLSIVHEWNGEIARCYRCKVELSRMLFRKTKSEDYLIQGWKDLIIGIDLADKFGNPEIILNLRMEESLLYLDDSRKMNSISDIEKVHKIIEYCYDIIGEHVVYLPKLKIIESRLNIAYYHLTNSIEYKEKSERLLKEALDNSQKNDLKLYQSKCKNLIAGLNK